MATNQIQETAELSEKEKAYIFDLIDFVLDASEDTEGTIWDDSDIVELIADTEQIPILKSIMEKLHDLGWSRHREHDVVTGLPYFTPND